MLHGYGFRCALDGEEKSLGFFTTRFVDAESEAAAGQRAIAKVRRERKFRRISRDLPSERIEVEEIAQVSFWAQRFSCRLGFSFYMAEEDAEPGTAPNAPGQR